VPRTVVVAAPGAGTCLFVRSQVRALLAAIEEISPELTAFFGCLYYACMRPGEAVFLRHTDCVSLPGSGWGLLLLSGNAPRGGSQWTDSGSTHDERHLKHRARKITRPVPIPPEMVDQIRAHIDRFGVSPDGRLFRGARGSLLSESSYGRVWQLARKKALAPAQANSPLARRPYDLRHSGVTLGLNAGVPHPKSRAAPGTASQSCSASTPDASTVTNSSGIPGSMTRSATRLPGDRVSPWLRERPSTARFRRELPGADNSRPRPHTRRPAGCFCWWWQVLGSNQRRLSRRFYRPVT
jgi:hypothetical protein